MREIISKIFHYYRYLKLKKFNSNLKVGDNFKCGIGCVVSRKNSIIIGNRFFMGNYCHLASNLIIGNDVMFASYVACVGGDHKVDNIKTSMNKSGRDILKTTLISDNVWIGHGAIILHGIKISSGAVIAAGSVVTKNVPENEIWGGNPAKLLRKRIIHGTNHPNH